MVCGSGGNQHVYLISARFLQESLLSLHDLESVTQAMYNTEKMESIFLRWFAIEIAENRMLKVLESKISMAHPLDDDLERP